MRPSREIWVLPSSKSEGRKERRSAGPNASSAVSRSYCFSSPKAATGAIAAVAIVSRPVVVGRVGEGRNPKAR